jgi:hypothetical protein
VSKPVTCARRARMLVSDQRERTRAPGTRRVGVGEVSTFGVRAARIRVS